MKKTLLFVVSCLLFLAPCVQASAPVPLWGEHGIVVNDTIGNTTQQNPKITKIGFLEYMMVWEDFRSGNSDLYIQKLDESGNRYWDKNGILLCGAQNEQIFPQITADGSGGAYVVWQDNRSGNFDIYLQRIDSNGNALFRQGGIRISQAPDGQVFPEIISDGQGGVIVAWQDYRAKEEDLYAQRIDPNGNILWEVDGAPVCREKGTQRSLQMISDSQSGAFVVWSDRRGADFDLYAQHINYQGKSAWVSNGIPICQAPGNQDSPKIVSNGQDGFFAGWSDGRPKDSGVYVQNITGAGKKLFAESGLRAANFFSGENTPDMAQGSMHDAIIVWADAYAGDSDVYMQKISYDGKLMWDEEGRPVVRVRGGQENPKIFGSGQNYYIVWEDLRDSLRQIYMQRINQDGYLSFGDGGLQIARDQHNALYSDFAIGEEGSGIVCYQDDKHGNFDIYAQRIDQAGKPNWGIYGKLINDTQGSVIHQNVQAVADNRNNIYFSFEDKRFGYSNIFVQKINPERFVMWELDGIGAAKVNAEQINSDIITDGKGGAYAVWEDYRNPSGSMIYMQHFNPQGDSAWKGGKVLTPGIISYNQKKPKIVSDGVGGAIVVFCDTRDTLNSQDIFAQRINSGGELLFSPIGKIVSSGNGVQDDPIISPSTFVVSWTDYRNGERNSDIYSQKLDLSGNALWEEDGVPICEAPDSQRDPEIVNDKEGGVIIVWTDRGGGNFDIYGQKVNQYGQAMWLKDGAPICQTGRTQQRPKIALSSSGSGLVIWEDFRFGNWDIFGQTLNSEGRVGVSEEGISICSAPGTQYNPDMISQNNNFIVAWEDYRNSSSYNIYFQALSLDGSKLWGDDGILANETRFGARLPKLISTGTDQFVLVWEDHRNGGHAIAAQKYKY